MKETYHIDVEGIERDLPLCRLNDSLYIAAFVMFGDVEITVHSAKKLLEKAPEFDILITAESKGIPLVHEMARQLNRNDYIVARKAPKLYMKDIITVEVKSITTEAVQRLCIGGREAELMKGKRVLIVDDVISTGESLNAIEALVKKAGGNIAGRMSVLAEGNAIGRNDITYLAPLPLFNIDGEPI